MFMSLSTPPDSSNDLQQMKDITGSMAPNVENGQIYSNSGENVLNDEM